uniref:GP-PDE domain-containing protein n=1 Tax=Podospora anserina (strain S / ATCC MYA-4624 / DSM 980 / FGSC 10383) TaxID=515849 RepID=A0A090CHV0_PODAN|nr:Putative protein similar to YE52 of Schizosaccharomyces pombe [Podospora anserina S mat+]
MTAEEILNDNTKPPSPFPLEKPPTHHHSNHHAAKPTPQIIAHRGYKALYPENSMLAIQEAIKAGAHAIETDVHESKDGVVVLSHDPTLNRCFSLPPKISTCTWPYLSTLRTTPPPHVPLARLSDLLNYLSTPDLSHIWVLLDIKTDDDPNLTLIPSIAATIASNPPPEGASWTWQERIVLGGWNENYLSALGEELPGFRRAYIGFSLLYAKRFLDDEKWAGVQFNLLQQAVVGPVGRGFVQRVRRARTERRLWVWTVNDERWMRWAWRKGVDGVVTDEVGLLKRVLDGDEDRGRGKGVTVGMYIKAAMIQALTLVLVVVIWGRLRKVGRVIGGEVKREQAKGKN